jgi:hypothetical protein
MSSGLIFTVLLKGEGPGEAPNRNDEQAESKQGRSNRRDLHVNARYRTGVPAQSQIFLWKGRVIGYAKGAV